MNRIDPAIEVIAEERAAEKLQRDVKAKREIIARLEEQLYLTEIGDVIRFKKSFRSEGERNDISPIVYSYAAIYVNDRWYTTSATHPQGFDKEQFILWLASGNPVIEVDVLT